MGNEQWDALWLFLTEQLNWVPFFALMLFLVIRVYGWKKSMFILLTVGLLVTFSDQFVNLLKDYFGRLRPNNDPALNAVIRILKRPRSYSFVSGHSTTSFAVITFMIYTLKEHYKYPFLLLVWPILFAYSRIYIGVHYPLDIFIGMIIGITIGYAFYKMSLLFMKNVF